MKEFFNITNPALSILISTVGARAVSSIINFCCNRFLTFGGKKISKSSIWKYYMLFFAQICASYALVYGFTMLFGGGQVFIKIVIDVILSICSYQVQMRWVFKKKSDKKRGAAQTEAVENTEEVQA